MLSKWYYVKFYCLNHGTPVDEVWADDRKMKTESRSQKGLCARSWRYIGSLVNIWVAFFFLKYIWNAMMSGSREEENKRDNVHPLIGSPVATTGRWGTNWRQSGGPYWAHAWWLRSKHLCCNLLPLLHIRSKLDRKQSSLNSEWYADGQWQGHKWWLNLLNHDTSPCNRNRMIKFESQNDIPESPTDYIFKVRMEKG